ncbi:MAG: hypothetical protein R3307_06550, partial [Anaerolineales bacterium]|nr:hypothetical protein [Anaerolineales bacterium]
FARRGRQHGGLTGHAVVAQPVGAVRIGKNPLGRVQRRLEIGIDAEALREGRSCRSWTSH